MRLLLDIISVAAFVMSLASWLYTFHVNRKKVALSIEHCWFEPSANIVEYQFRIVITNLSRLPLAVTHLSVEHAANR